MSGVREREREIDRMVVKSIIVIPSYSRLPDVCCFRDICCSISVTQQSVIQARLGFPPGLTLMLFSLSLSSLSPPLLCSVLMSLSRVVASENTIASRTGNLSRIALIR